MHDFVSVDFSFGTLTLNSFKEAIVVLPYMALLTFYDAL
jgi:hypothetical protein